MITLTQVGDFSSFFKKNSARVLAMTGTKPPGPPYRQGQAWGEVA